jgi:anti-anti-sigma factor
MATFSTSGAVLRISAKARQEAAVLGVEGEVDISNTYLLSNAIEDAYRTNGSVVVDLNHVQYLDASGIRILLRAANEHDGRFAVVSPESRIHHLFVILNLVEALPVVGSTAQAIEYLRPRRTVTQKTPYALGPEPAPSTGDSASPSAVRGIPHEPPHAAWPIAQRGTERGMRWKTLNGVHFGEDTRIIRHTGSC